jgi:hypothetical protein
MEEISSLSIIFAVSIVRVRSLLYF